MSRENPIKPGAGLSGRIGAVVIGRNEGERLRRCLASLSGRAAWIVYVDSGSTDGSVAFALSVGISVVDLDRSIGFTAARARNAGLERLQELAPDLELVQFIDGDCQMSPGWLESAEPQLLADPKMAVVCGRRREKYPDSSIYNRLCDLEWDTPVGPADACGGDALMRYRAVVEVQGYDPHLIAGEEPDLCLRMRRHGWKVLRLDAEMTEHDAAMTKFHQWWKRSVRAGHAYAEGSARHGSGPERHWVRETRSNWLWGLAVPAVALGLVVPTAGFSMALLAGYLVLAARIYRGARRRGFSAANSRLYSAFCVLGKVPMVVGQALYWTKRVSGRRGGIIEYKNASS